MKDKRFDETDLKIKDKRFDKADQKMKDLWWKRSTVGEKKELVYRRRRHAAASLSVKLCQQVRGRFSLSLEVSRWEAAQADERQGNCFHPENQPCLSFDG